ncbi:MAG: DUF1801 domain-containing protein [Bacteroidota bacterium]
MAKKVSPDKGKTVAWYIEEKLAEDWQKETVQALHELVLEIMPDAKHTIKWAQPVYESPEGPAVFMKAAKKHVTFGFWRGAELDDPNGVLEGSGEKMRHVKVKGLDKIDREVLVPLVEQAVALNAAHGDPTKG